MKNNLNILFLLCVIFNTLGQDETTEKKFSISGSIDAYFRTNLTGPNTAMEDLDGGSYFLNPGTAFADRSGFSIGMANVILGYEGEKVGFVADLVFGPRGEAAVFLSSPSTNIVNQLYAFWNVTDKVTLTLGNFNTFLGYEVISPTGNFNYSTSYMFSYGPFSHTGFKADIAISEDFSLMLGVMNSTDWTEINLDGSYTAGAQLGYKGQFLNLIYGDQTGTTGPTFQVDYTGGFDLTNSFYLGINSTYNDTDGSGFYGVALYPQYAFSESFALGLRGEYFNTFANASDDENVIAVTLSGNYSIGGLKIIPELRFDNWSQDYYLNSDSEPTSSLASFLVAAVFAF